MPDTASSANEPITAQHEPIETALKHQPHGTNDDGKDVKIEDNEPTLSNGHKDAIINHHETSPTVDSKAELELNGHDNHDEAERPSKRRRTRDVTPPPTATRKPKIVSPPWKKAAADGPTSYTENGRRKSGRVNTIPIEHQPPSAKRLTRRALHEPHKPASPAVSSSPSSTRRPQTPATQSSRTPQTNGRRNSVRQNGHTRQVSDTTPKSSKRGTNSVTTDTKPSVRSTRRRSPSPPPRQGVRHSARQQQSARVGAEDDGQTAAPGRSTRIKLRVTRSGVIPLVHPGQIPKRPRICSNFEEFWTRAGDIPVDEGGLLSAEDGVRYTSQDARRDAEVILRIEKEAEDGGILSSTRCALFAPSGSDEPPRLYARQDHMTRAVTNFRKLMLAEQRQHRATAKRIAEACRDEWYRRQPKSTEQLEAEERDKWLAKYKFTVRHLLGTWENVRLEVNRRRLAAWEAEEQKRVKAALNEAVNLSEQKLQARQAGLDSELVSEDDDGFDDLTDDASELETGLEDGTPLAGDGDDSGAEADSDADDSDNMSSDDEEDEGDEAKEAGDEDLTPDQLRAKYAKIPELPQEAPKEMDSVLDTEAATMEEPATETGVETSDESVDMDDDMGTSDEEDDEESEEEDSDDASESETGGAGLLGLFFDKSELKKLEDSTTNGTGGSAEDIVMADVSLAANDDTPLGETPEDLEEEDEDDMEMSLVQFPPSTDHEDNDDLTNGVDHESAADAPTAGMAVIDLPPEASNADAVDSEIVTTVASPDLATDDMAKKTNAGAPRDASGEVEPLISLTAHAERQDEVQAESKPTDAQEMLDTPATIDSAAEGTDADTVKSNAQETSKEVSRATSIQPVRERKTEIPFLLRGTLREYQHDGLDWLAGLYANNTNGILADEMGLGKTIQTIALLAHLASHHEVWGPHLVIVPTSVMLNWEMEFKKWCPGFKILAYYGTQEERKRKRQGWNNDDVWNVCITSYQLVLQDQQVFKRRRWHYMILDEAHNIKNFKSQRWQTLLGFNTQARLLLTGTPLQNNLTELWSLLFFLMPAENGVGGFADLQEFHDWFHKPETQILESGREQMDDEAKAIISKLHKVLRPYLLRRLKADVEKQMPAKYEHVEFCRLSKRQRELYDGFLARADTKNTLAGGNYLSIINCLMQLRKVCNHPDLFVDRPIMTSFRMSKSVVSDFDLAQRRVGSLLEPPLMSQVDLGFLNLIPTRYEHLRSYTADTAFDLDGTPALRNLEDAQITRFHQTSPFLNPSTASSTLAYLDHGARFRRLHELQHTGYQNKLRRQRKPLYGKNLIELLTIGTDQRPSKPKPKVPQKIMAWFEDDSALIRAACPSLDVRADQLRIIIEKFSCVTPAVITRDLEQFVLGRKGVQSFTEEDLKLSKPVRWAPFMPKEPPIDPWHEARMRLSIQFPDKRLLQYDCGKLQALDKLLRKLQTGGHRALIFTQMTKVLDILEQFLNIHGHKYLRLDGATKVEQRQILTDRFNHDPRILCFILSTRSGGLGINLTGADTVIFYDQDWNPAMDKQCQDRCHRIGQTRDVHIYRLISEHTIEANILRKASQKQMLDDVVIQEGEFTTDRFDKGTVRDVLGEKLDMASEGISAADAALDRVLGVPDNSSSSQRTVGRVLEQAEDKEDVTAARAAEREILADDADFTEKGPNGSNTASGASTTRQGTPAGVAGRSVLDGGVLDPMTLGDAVEDVDADAAEVEMNAWGEKMSTIDDYMLGLLGELLKDVKLEVPRDKKRGKKRGRDTRKR